MEDEATCEAVESALAQLVGASSANCPLTLRIAAAD